MQDDGFRFLRFGLVRSWQTYRVWYRADSWCNRLDEGIPLLLKMSQSGEISARY